MKNRKSITTIKKYADGGNMKFSKNLVESRKTISASKKVLLKKPKNSSKNMRKLVSVTNKFNNIVEDSSPIIFDSEMRKTFLKGVIQDIKGYFEERTSGAISIIYEEVKLKKYEFAFKLYVNCEEKCTKQIFSEVSSAIVNVVNYMFPIDIADRLDVTIFNNKKKLEIEFVSLW